MNQQQETSSIRHLQDFEQLVQTIIDDGHVPGAAVILIKDGDVVLSKGFGKRNLAENLAVTPRTLFPIGSSTKAFTTTALAMLVAEGKLEWDTPVQHYLPSFKLQDQFASERIALRDLVSHRSGLPRHDFLWYGSRFSRKEVVERLAYLEPSADFRTLYQYNNLMFVTAGYLLEQVSGQTWEAFVAERIFKPLGMTTSTFFPHDSRQTNDYALPYAEEDGVVNEIPFYDAWQITGPAGSISANLEDMQHWLRFHLNQGKHGETQLVDAVQLAQTHLPQMVIPPGTTVPRGAYKEFAHWSYGMGWFVGSYKGHRMVQHGGTIDGFKAEVALLPDDHIAVAVFVNLNRSETPNTIAFSACDYLLGVEVTDWNSRYMAEMQQVAEQIKQIEAMQKIEAVPDAPPSHPLESYVGEYEHPAYGKVAITCTGEGLQLTYNGVSSQLTHIHYDLFEWSVRRLLVQSHVAFTTNEKGTIESFTFKVEPTVKPQVFTRVPDGTHSEPLII